MKITENILEEINKDLENGSPEDADAKIQKCLADYPLYFEYLLADSDVLEEDAYTFLLLSGFFNIQVCSEAGISVPDVTAEAIAKADDQAMADYDNASEMENPDEVFDIYSDGSEEPLAAGALLSSVFASQDDFESDEEMSEILVRVMALIRLLFFAPEPAAE